MSAQAVEALLAELFTDAALRERFLAAPLAVAEAAGLDPAEAAALEGIDRIGLVMAARSYASKRAGRQERRERASGLFGRLWRAVARSGTRG